MASQIVYDPNAVFNNPLKKYESLVSTDANDKSLGGAVRVSDWVDYTSAEAHGLPSFPAIDKDGFLMTQVNVAEPIAPVLDKTLVTPKYVREEKTSDLGVGSDLIAGGEYSFPLDVGQPHHPDFVNFYFLDLVRPDGTWVNNDKLYFEDAIIASASKQSGSMAGNDEMIRKSLAAVGKAGKGLGNFAAAGVKGAGEILGFDTTNAVNKINAAAEDFANDPTGASDTYKITGDVVKIMMPSSVEFNDGAGWQSVNSSPTMIGMIADIALTETTFKEVGKWELNKWVSSVLYEDGAGAASSLSQKVYNPYVSQAFESMQRRQFRFDWLVTPKNQSELNNIKAIIQLFRYHMHPSLSDTNTFLRYPSQVDIKFFVDGGAEENSWLPKVTTCVIKDFSTNYTPNGQWITSNANRGGAPYQFRMSLTIEEIVPLVKQDVMKGY
jgi:hypothetical protein